MKKIIATARESWLSQLCEYVDTYGDIDDSLDTYRIEDDGIGIVGDNELYHVSNDEIDFFFLKVGDKYTEISTTCTPERLLWNNFDKLDLTQSWFDLRKVMEWFKDSNEDELDGCPIEFYELIWMGIYNIDNVSTFFKEFKDIEIDTPENEEGAESDPTPETPAKQPISECVEDIVQDLRDSLTAQKKVVWSFICNRFEKDKKDIDMKRMPDAIADADGFQFSIQGDGDFFAIVILEGDVKILYRPGGDEEQETYFDWKVMSYEALLDILYAMA